MARVSLRNIHQHPTNVVDFGALTGGLNLRDLDYRLRPNESPEMLNLWWQDGLLQTRDGQVRMIASEGNKGRCYAAYERPYNGIMAAHIGDRLWIAEPGNRPGQEKWYPIATGVPENRGTFFRYGDYLYYKNRGGFFRISVENDEPKVESVARNAFVPTTVINANPDSGSGDLYQPENRLSAAKRITYNAAASEKEIKLTGAENKRLFALGVTAAEDLQGLKSVYVGSAYIEPALYKLDKVTGYLEFTAAPAQGAEITVTALIAKRVYQLPVKQIDRVESVKVDGKVLDSGYTVDAETGTVTFDHGPGVTVPPTNNTVEIVYSKANPDAASSILDCPYATVYGGGQDLCVVLGGCPAQPNAFFWSGNTDVGMDISYWPMSYYNLAGRTDDAVTGFGKQYSELVIFKQESIGKASFDIVSVEERGSISLTYQAINDRIGCDLPWSIQLIENNLVWANTRGGAYILRDSSAADENNVVAISDKVNGTPARRGLLWDVAQADPDQVCSMDDGSRYWLCANGHVWAWDYAISPYKDTSWFLFDNIHMVAFMESEDGQRRYHVDAEGNLTEFRRVFMDFGEGINKVYQFPPQAFGTYDRMKDILYVIISIRSDTDASIAVEYRCDYGAWREMIPLTTRSWRLWPRNLAARSLAAARYAIPQKRKPGLKHVQHFAVRLSDNAAGQDLAVNSAQIYYRLTSKLR